MFITACPSTRFAFFTASRIAPHAAIRMTDDDLIQHAPSAPSSRGVRVFVHCLFHQHFLHQHFHDQSQGECRHDA